MTTTTAPPKKKGAKTGRDPGKNGKKAGKSTARPRTSPKAPPAAETTALSNGRAAADNMLQLRELPVEELIELERKVGPALLEPAIRICQRRNLAERLGLAMYYKNGVDLQLVHAVNGDASVAQVCAAVGMAPAVGYRALKLIEHVSEAQLEELVARKVSWGTLSEILNLSKAKDRRKFIERLLDSDLTAEDFRALRNAAGLKRGTGGRPVQVPRRHGLAAAKLVNIAARWTRELEAYGTQLPEIAADYGDEGVVSVQQAAASLNTFLPVLKSRLQWLEEWLANRTTPPAAETPPPPRREGRDLPED